MPQATRGTNTLLFFFIVIAALIVIGEPPAPPNPARVAITNVEYPQIATGGDHIGMNITTTVKNIGGTRGAFGVIAQPANVGTDGIWIEPGGEHTFHYIDGVYMPNHDYNVQLQAYCFINGSYRIDHTENITILADEITVFRDKCMDSESVTCSWTVLKPYLEDHTVSRIWWNLTRDERYSISEKAIKNTFYYVISNWRQGASNCVGGDGAWSTARCVINSIIRYRKFGHGFENEKLDACYWRRSSAYNEFCYVSDTTYNLPVHMVSIDTPGHSMCAVHITQGIDSLDNWLIFQYDKNQFDAKPGDPCMPNGCVVKIREPIELMPSCAGYSHSKIPVATFQL